MAVTHLLQLCRHASYCGGENTQYAHTGSLCRSPLQGEQCIQRSNQPRHWAQGCSTCVSGSTRGLTNKQTRTHPSQIAKWWQVLVDASSVADSCAVLGGVRQHHMVVKSEVSCITKASLVTVLQA